MKDLERIVLIGLTLGMFLMLTACPYASSVPIDKANTKIDKNLIGKWKKFSGPESADPEYLEISDVDGNYFNITKLKYKSTDSSYSKTVYLAHISKIDDYIFLNMQEDGKGSYYLHRVEYDGKNKFKIYEVTDNIDEKFNTSEELKDFVKKYMHLSFFYNKEEELYVKEQ